MNETQRIERIKNLLEQRDRYSNPKNEVEYILYNQPILALNDEGHIDWMMKKIIKYKKNDYIKQKEKMLEEIVNDLIQKYPKDKLLIALDEIKANTDGVLM